MKINCKYIRRAVNEEGMVEVTFITSPFTIHQVEKLEKGENYILDLEKKKEKRSLEQNSYMWSIIHQIATARNGRANTENEWDIYLEALEKAGAKYEIITCVPAAETLLVNNYRAVKLVGTGELKGRTYNSYKVFYGSSSMNKEEMAKLLDEVLNMAAREGIDAELHVF